MKQPATRMPKRFQAIANNPEFQGEMAAPKHIFGKLNRYAIAPVHSRTGEIGWLVWDAETPDTSEPRDPVLGYPPAVIRICTSYEEAVAGLA